MAQDSVDDRICNFVNDLLGEWGVELSDDPRERFTQLERALVANGLRLAVVKEPDGG